MLPGNSNEIVAGQLSISEETVKTPYPSISSSCVTPRFVATPSDVDHLHRPLGPGGAIPYVRCARPAPGAIISSMIALAALSSREGVRLGT
jgi:hypothetical protein